MAKLVYGVEEVVDLDKATYTCIDCKSTNFKHKFGCPQLAYLHRYYSDMSEDEWEDEQEDIVSSKKVGLPGGVSGTCDCGECEECEEETELCP